MDDAVVKAPMLGTVVRVAVAGGEQVREGQPLVILESMKMEHIVAAPRPGVVAKVMVTAGDTVRRDEDLVALSASDAPSDAPVQAPEADLDDVRPDLAEVIARHDVGRDENRPDAVARRHDAGQRTARENVEAVCDPGTFTEYGPLVLAAQRQRRSLEDLIERTPADGLVAGVGKVNGESCAVLAYDATVLAGTQGARNHQKQDRLFELAERRGLPVILFAEGGGGRPGDVDVPSVAGLHLMTFHTFARLSGHVPLVGVAAGKCFAGNAALLGCCDVIIATRDSSVGMGGPAMIAGGGLGVVKAEDVGPIGVQAPNGVVDVVVEDEVEAAAVAKQYLSYFQGATDPVPPKDQRLLRHAVPERRVEVYDVRAVIDTLADDGSVLELRREFGVGIVTALIRIDGVPYGLIANNPAHLGGAIDSDAADKAARFLQLCDGHGLPVVSLCDTPGFLVGPEAEETATVRHFSRMFVVGASLRVPLCVIVLRKAYGLGAMAMAGGSMHAPVASVAWPTGEFGGMGLEGAVKLGYRKELAAVADPDERQALFDRMVAEAYERGKGLSAASVFEIDDVIDPADTRRWITASLEGVPVRGTRPHIDTW